VGGSSGIGLGVAEALLQEGATVTIVGRTEEKLRATWESLWPVRWALSHARLPSNSLPPGKRDLAWLRGDTYAQEIAGCAKNQMWAEMGKRVPAGRIAIPADIAKAYSLPLGNELTTGIVLKIGGGHPLI